MSNKKKIFVLGVIASMIVIIFSSISINKSFGVKKYFDYEFVDGEVLKIKEESITPDPLVPGRYVGKQKIEVKLLEGVHKGKTYDVINVLSNRHNIFAKPGMKAIFTVRMKDGKEHVWFYNYKMDRYIYILVGLFALTLVVFGKMSGVKSIISLLFTGVIIIFVLLPIIFRGGNPIPWAMLLCSVITVVTFLLIGDFNRKTYAAILGTIIGVVISGIISYTFGSLAKLSGIHMEKGEQILYLAADYHIQINGLMFTSILIASLGAINDVAMSIASSCNELCKRNPDIHLDDLYASLMDIGKDIMGTMTNTLILAFTGSSLNLMLMIWGFQMTTKQFINMPLIAIELVQAISGSIGIVLTVPITAGISIYLIKKKGNFGLRKVK
ncbi:MAG: YibE/F family protein [Psychrilyobacter sp.]|nr:YibE/F family protein [Psychrilyobacter sp.]